MLSENKVAQLGGSLYFKKESGKKESEEAERDDGRRWHGRVMRVKKW